MDPDGNTLAHFSAVRIRIRIMQSTGYAFDGAFASYCVVPEERIHLLPEMAHLFVSDKLKLNENFVNESVYGTKFEGRVIKSVNVGSHPGAVPKISGSAFITGFHQFVLDINDPLRTGL